MLYCYYKLYNKLFSNTKYVLISDTYTGRYFNVFKTRYITGKWFFYDRYHMAWKEVNPLKCTEIK